MKKRIVSVFFIGALVLSLLSGCADEDIQEIPDVVLDEDIIVEETVKEENKYIQFTSTTVDGMEIDTSVLASYDLTVINIWATWCNPCVGELPELQEVYEALPEGVNLLGICVDAEDDLDFAKQVIEQTGVKYETIIANSEMFTDFLDDVRAYPTTFFVDSEGNLVGEPMVGAPRSDAKQIYLDVIDEHLELLNY